MEFKIWISESVDSPKKRRKAGEQRKPSVRVNILSVVLMHKLEEEKLKKLP